MTVIAGIAAGNVRRMLAGGNDTIVARATGSDYLRVIDDGRRHPDSRAMAIFADVGRQNVRLIFAGRLGAVMAADTVTKDVYVFEIRRYPGGCEVTVITGITAGNMRRILAGRSNAVMATNTITNNAKVIENSRKPPG